MSKRDDVLNALKNRDYEVTPEGFYVPAEKAMVQGIVCYGKRGEEEEWTHNLIVTEGLNYLVGSATGSVSAIGTWYVAVFSGDVTVGASWTAANFSANSTEFTQYEAATRPQWVPGAVSGGIRDSFASKAEFKSTVDGAILRGAALISASGKGATSGTLMGATKFPNAKPLDTDEILDVGYGLQISAA